MKILCLTTLVCSTVAFSQTVTYEGKVVDEYQTPISYADVLAVDGNNNIVEGVITDDNGDFKLEIGTDSLVDRIEITFMGFEDQTIIPNTSNLGIITLKEKVAELQEIVFTARRPVIEQKVDRLIFNVENSITGSNGTALDALKVTPGLQVNDNGVNIVGKSSVRVLVNDRMVQLSNEELISYLSSFASDDIKNIEVITTPPAKYEAEGNSGLINIVLKKAWENSWSNQVRGSYIQTTYPAFKLGNTFNYNHNKWQILASVDGKKGHSQYRNNADIYYPNGLWKNETIEKRSKNYISTKLGVDYKLTPNSDIGFLYSGDFLTPNSEEKHYSYIFDTNNQNVGKITTDGVTDETKIDHILNVHYLQKLDTLGKKMSIDLDYFNYKDDQDRVFSSKQTGNQAQFQKTNNKGSQNIKNYSAKIDFEHPTNFADFSYGGRIAQTKTDNEIKFFDLSNGSPVLDEQKSNVFEYTENIEALYVDMMKVLSPKWQMKLGLRSEFTQTKGYSKDLDQTNTNNYIKIFPTVYFNYTKDENNIFNLSYSRRVDRPDFSTLNPFRLYSNAHSYVTGNPYLQPSISNNLEFKYILNQNYITELFFSQNSDASTQINELDVVNNKEIYTYINIGNVYYYGAKQTAIYRPFYWWNTTNMLAVFYSGMRMYEDLDFKAKTINGWSAQFYSNQVFSLNTENTIQAEMTFFAATKSYREFDELKPFYKLDLGLKMQFLDEKVQVSAVLNDVFRSSILHATAYSNDVKQEYINDYDNRYFTLGLTYKFGNDKISVSERDKGNQDELDRAN